MYLKFVDFSMFISYPISYYSYALCYQITPDHIQKVGDSIKINHSIATHLALPVTCFTLENEVIDCMTADVL